MSDAARPADLVPRPGVPDGLTPWALFLDVDGTLLEFSAHPDLVMVDAALCELLDRLAAGLDGALALVSGRAIETLDRLFAPRRFAAAGLHGLELRPAGGPALHSMPLTAATRLLDCLADELEAGLSLFTGVLVERKGPALALHYRQAPSAAAAVKAAARATQGLLGDGYRLQEGHAVVELVPVSASKGVAIGCLLEQPPFRGRRPVFIGDDLTDEGGFSAVNARQGLSIRVGDQGDSAASCRLADTHAVRRWLSDEVCPALERLRDRSGGAAGPSALRSA